MFIKFEIWNMQNVNWLYNSTQAWRGTGILSQGTQGCRTNRLIPITFDEIGRFNLCYFIFWFDKHKSETCQFYNVQIVFLASDDENIKNRQNKSAKMQFFFKKVLICDRSGEAGRRELGDGVRRCEDAVLATLLVWRPKLCCWFQSPHYLGGFY